ncbi:MAG: hypothetical protein NTY02_11040 [Acidobacteria bacterium]|nr:hypothetical protein [Acidobacteriota bacterium]
MTNQTPAPPGPYDTMLGLAAFAVLGALAGRALGRELTGVLVGCVAALAVLTIGAWLLRILLAAVNREVRVQHGGAAIGGAVWRGFLMIVPFAVLAAVADLVLDWNAVQAFTATAIMTSCGAAGVELTRLGGKALVNGLLSTLVGMAIFGGWMVLVALLGSA